MRNRSSLIIGGAFIVVFTMLGLFLLITFEESSEDTLSTWGYLGNGYDLLFLGLIVVACFYFIYKFRKKIKPY